MPKPNVKPFRPLPQGSPAPDCCPQCGVIGDWQNDAAPDFCNECTLMWRFPTFKAGYMICRIEWGEWMFPLTPQMLMKHWYDTHTHCTGDSLDVITVTDVTSEVEAMQAKQTEPNAPPAAVAAIPRQRGGHNRGFE